MSGWISSKLKVAETLLQQIDQQAAESLRKNEALRSDDDLSHAASAAVAIIPKKSGDILPQLKKKKKTPLPPATKPDKTDVFGQSHNLNINPRKSSLTDSDWTQLLSSSAPPINSGGGGLLPREVSGLSREGKRHVRSGSNLLALERKPLLVLNKSASVQRTSSQQQPTLGVQDDLPSHEMQWKDATPNSVIDGTNKDLRPSPPMNDEKPPQVKNEENSSMLLGSGVPITTCCSSSSSRKMEVNDGDTDSDSSSDSESEGEREERRKRREQLLVEKAAAKAIEAIKDRENLVARLEGEKQSLEKIIDERAKQQAQEASELQMTMMETMEAVDLEKQKHNNTRIEILMKLAKLETTNAELAKSLATAQWSLELEVKRVAELHRQIELKEASHEVELTSKKKNHLSGNKLTTIRGVKLEHEMLEAEHTFVKDKVGQLQEKTKTLESTIQVTRKEIENPTEVEVELKRRLGQLTDHLIHKQAQVEALSSEKAMLMFRIEVHDDDDDIPNYSLKLAVSRTLDESKLCLKVPMNDLESGRTWELSNSMFQKGQKHIGSFVRQLYSIFLTGATFLRRNPMARIWSFVYLVCLHFWVLYIFRSYTSTVS